MSKRAKEKALELFPIDMQMCIDNKGKPYEADVNEHRRKYVAFGYEQAEKDTIERAVRWIAENTKRYVGQVGHPFWDMFLKHFRKYMEEGE